MLRVLTLFNDEFQIEVSGSRFFNIAAQFGNLSSKKFGSIGIAPSDGNGKRELQFFKLMATFKKAAAIA